MIRGHDIDYLDLESGVLKIFYRYFLESNVIFLDMIVLDTDFLLPFFSVQL